MSAGTDFTVEDVHTHDGLVKDTLDRLFEDLDPKLRPLVLESVFVAYIRRMALTVEQTAMFVGTLMPRVGKRLGDGEDGYYRHLLVPATANDDDEVPGDG